MSQIGTSQQLRIGIPLVQMRLSWNMGCLLWFQNFVCVLLLSENRCQINACTLDTLLILIAMIHPKLDKQNTNTVAKWFRNIITISQHTMQKSIIHIHTNKGTFMPIYGPFLSPLVHCDVSKLISPVMFWYILYHGLCYYALSHDHIWSRGY